MGRLTGRYYDVTNDIWHWSIKSNSTNDGLVATPQDILDKLAYYEDMEEQGLLIKLDLNQYKRDDLDRCTHRHCNNCDKYRRELQKYKDLEEQGRLIELPCALYDVVWSIQPFKVVRSDSIGSFGYSEDGLEMWDWNGEWIGIFGKTAFLTKEEAEAKLEELKGE